MSKGAKELAMLLHNRSHSAAKHHAEQNQMVFATVISVDPLLIRPLTSSQALPEDAFGWTLTAAALRDDLTAGANLLITQVHGRYYVIDAVE